jgi:hypothetical protein
MPARKWIQRKIINVVALASGSMMRGPENIAKRGSSMVFLREADL